MPFDHQQGALETTELVPRRGQIARFRRGSEPLEDRDGVAMRAVIEVTTRRQQKNLLLKPEIGRFLLSTMQPMPRLRYDLTGRLRHVLLHR
jgi:hypothetical protein